MDLNDWLTFARIVELGGLGAASRRLGLPKSTLSRRLARLEEAFGSRLLNRRGRRFALTETGRLFYEEARGLTAQVADARERLADRVRHETGTIRMTAPKTPGGEFLGVWLAEFLEQYPEIRIELDLSDRVVSLIEQGYDLALRAGPMTDSTLIASSLGGSERILVAARSYLKRHGRPGSPAALARYRCIGFGEQINGRVTWVLTHGKRTHRMNFQPVLRCDDMRTVWRVAMAGAGIALAPAFVCRGSLGNAGLERVLPDWSGPRAQFHLVYPERKLMPGRVRRLVDFLRARARSEPWRFALD